jgi:2,3-diketo-5-methylthio-1-phosphopentane phosphatase
LNNQKTAILSDFDGTITPTQVLNTIYEKFAAPSYKETLARWDKGEISTMEEVETVFKTITSSKRDIEGYLDTVALDPGFQALRRYCMENDHHFAVLSDGFFWYIDYILNKHGVNGTEVYASDIHFEENGFRFSYPWYDPSTPMRSTSKPTVVRDFQRRGYEVVFIGDGLSDQEVLGVADVVYAKDVLLEYAMEIGEQVKPFTSIEDVVEDLKARDKVKTQG